MMTLSIGSSSQTSLNSVSYGSNQPSEISTHNKSRYFYTRGLKRVLGGLVSDKGQNICQIVSRIKPSNTHRKTGAGFIQHIRSAQSQLLNGWGDENGKCNWISVSWVVCTENKICETILKQYRPKFLRCLWPCEIFILMLVGSIEYLWPPSTMARASVMCAFFLSVSHPEISISTRKSACEPGRRKHKRKHQKMELFLPSCACVIMSYLRTGTTQAQAQDKHIKHWSTRKMEVCFSADKQTHVSSPIPTQPPRWRRKLRRHTAPAYVLVLMSISLVWTSLYLCLRRSYVWTSFSVCASSSFLLTVLHMCLVNAILITSPGQSRQTNKCIYDKSWSATASTVFFHEWRHY